MHIFYHSKMKAFLKLFVRKFQSIVESPIRVLKENKRVLKKDGFALITVPNLIELRRILSIIRNPSRIRQIEVDHKQGWDAIEFTRLAFQAGLSVEIDWTDWCERTRRKEKFKFLNPLLKHILPKPTLLCAHENYMPSIERIS